MFATVECEAAVFGFRTLRPDSAGDVPHVLALPGADHVLHALPKDRWAVLSDGAPHDVAAQFSTIELPPPGVVLAIDLAGPAGDSHRRAATELAADPSVCLAFEDTGEGVAAATAAGVQVIGVAAFVPPDELAGADLVVPSLLSVRVLGTHPFIVLEVDAIPDLGTGAARRR